MPILQFYSKRSIRVGLGDLAVHCDFVRTHAEGNFLLCAGESVPLGLILRLASCPKIAAAPLKSMGLANGFLFLYTIHFAFGSEPSLLANQRQNSRFRHRLAEAT